MKNKDGWDLAIALGMMGFMLYGIISFIRDVTMLFIGVMF